MPRYYKVKRERKDGSYGLYEPHELKDLFKEWLKIQEMKTPDLFEIAGKTKKDVWIDMHRQRDKQLQLNRAKL